MKRKAIAEDVGLGRVKIVCRHDAMRELIEKSERIAQNPHITVLIRGASGTGKELIARLIHSRGPSNAGPFVEINCSAIPDTLLEAELFGHEKGAFTDAKIKKKGLFELADGGTVFLDEIGTMSMKLQSKLLRVIEEKRFMRLGGTEEIEVSVRIIAATNIDLEKALEDGTFREDLYYRLNVIYLELPLLRDRGDDVILLAEHFLNRFSSEYNRDIRGLSPEAKQVLSEYAWPGNVRELKNTIERAVFMGSGDVIEPEHLEITRRVREPLSKASMSPVTVTSTGKIEINFPSSGISLEAVEQRLIQSALEACRWNVSQAAKLLSLSRDTLRYRIKKFDLDSQET
ncbi:MAG: sigma 54-interacting transcriptional regulator [Gemmatimonadota bacterium]|nr:MAG: sigma 54-interacting transcriptional regulator [Gemmatimonadota bacterium]